MNPDTPLQSNPAQSHVIRSNLVGFSPVTPPGFLIRIQSIWYRHFKVYAKHLISNGFPPFVEPLFFLTGIGLGLGHYIGLIEGLPFMIFLATGMITPSAMFTAAFECTFGTFIRLEFDKAYDGMISASLNVTDLFLGEILFAGTKGFFFSFAVLIIFFAFGLIPSKMGFFAPIGGFLTGLSFGALSLFVTSFVKNINHFNFYITGALTPMFFFSGIIFPISNLPEALQPLPYIFPLTHCAIIIRGFCLNQFEWHIIFSFIYLLIFIIVFSYFAIKRLSKRIIQ